MRFVYFLLLLVMLAAVIVFAIQNDARVALKFVKETVELPLSALVGGVYVLGMLSGWTVVGFVRRSIHEITDPRYAPRQQA